jgi:hypothetical protein
MIVIKNWMVWGIIFSSILIMIIDTLISNIGLPIENFYQSMMGNVFFIISIILAIFLQFMLTFYIFSLTKQIFITKSTFQLLKYLNLGFTVFISILLITIAIQISHNNQYNTHLLIWITSISYLQTVTNMLFLSFRFYKWFKENKTMNIFFYLLWSISTSIAFFSQLLINDIVLLFDKPAIIISTSITSWPEFTGLKEIISSSYAIVDIISYSLLWISTVTLLIRYSNRIGKVYYWTLMSLPLIYYLMYNLDSYGLLPINSVTSDLLFSINSTWGGVLFGLVFLSIRKKIDNKTKVRDFLLVLASGIILLFTANQATTMGTSFPPYGLITVSFAGISSYLIFIGTMASALSLANDIIIRREIGKTVKNELKLLDEITISEMIKQSESNIIKIIKKKESILERESKISSDLSKEEIQKYIAEVIIDEKEKMRNKY